MIIERVDFTVKSFTGPRKTQNQSLSGKSANKTRVCQLDRSNKRLRKTHLSDFLQILAVVGSPQHIDRESDSVEYKMQTRDFEQTRFPLGAF